MTAARDELGPSPNRCGCYEFDAKPSWACGLKVEWGGIIIRPFFLGHSRENLVRKGAIDDEDDDDGY